MQQGAISKYFAGAATKILSAVEVDTKVSRQHEFGGVASLRRILGDDRASLEARFLYLTDDDSDLASAGGAVTWYDSREDRPDRAPEFRLYFPSTSVTERARPGDLLIVAKRKQREVLILIAPAGHSIGQKLLWLFGLEAPADRFKTSVFEPGDPTLGFVARQLLDEIGIETDIPPTAEGQLERLLKEFGGEFPTTAKFSAFARNTALPTSPEEAPDEAIVTWLDHEEDLFRVLERHLVENWLKTGIDVDGFLKFSLQVHQRRKSRAGYAAENHLEAIFLANKLRFDRGVKTEGKSKPDFLFPGKAAYLDPAFATRQLAMLGVKTTCKDRWRQVLTEANRIEHKHLFTIEPGISDDQTSEMMERQVQLVVPEAIHNTFNPRQQDWLWNLEDFIRHVAEIERH